MDKVPDRNPENRDARPSCTVIVCTRRRPIRLRRCLESLRRLDYPNAAVLVVENDSASTEAKAIAFEYGAGYRLCARQGLSAARNLGVRTSSSEILAFIDDDAVCESGWISSAIPHFAGDRVLAVTGKAVFHADKPSDSPPVSVFDPGTLIVGRETPDWFGMANFGGLGLGMNFFVRRSAFDLVGFFDERLGRGSPIYGGEEQDFLYRILDAGYRVATCSDCVVRHAVENLNVPGEAFRAISASTSVFTMLAVEQPRNLPKLVRYAWGAIRREPQWWRKRPPRLFNSVKSRWIVFPALAAGPFLYFCAALRAALSRKRHHDPADR